MTIEPSKDYIDGLVNGQSVIIADAVRNILDFTKEDVDVAIDELMDRLLGVCLHAHFVRKEDTSGRYTRIISFINEYNKDRKEVKE